MPFVIQLTHSEILPYREPLPSDRLCPLRDFESCVGSRCALWRGDECAALTRGDNCG